MRYIYNPETGLLKQVTHVEAEDQVISNPPDELVDSLMAGYPLLEDPEPAYDPAKEQCFPYYQQEPEAIRKKWRLAPLPDPEPTLEERLCALEAENAALRSAIAAGVDAFVDEAAAPAGEAAAPEDEAAASTDETPVSETEGGKKI